MSMMSWGRSHPRIFPHELPVVTMITIAWMIRISAVMDPLIPNSVFYDLHVPGEHGDSFD